MVNCPDCGTPNSKSNPRCKQCGFVLLHSQSNWRVVDCGRCRGQGCKACYRGKVVTWGPPKICKDCRGNGSGPYGPPQLDKPCRGTGYSNGFRHPGKIASWR